MLFTSEVCLPELINQEKLQTKKKETDAQIFLSETNDQDKEIIPFVCFFNAMSFLKRLPSTDEMQDEDNKLDLLAGYRMKDSFLELKKDDDAAKCQTDLQGLYEEQIDGRQLDGLLPFQEKYLGNGYIDVYQYFCREKPTTSKISNVKSMYSTGLQL